MEKLYFVYSRYDDTIYPEMYTNEEDAVEKADALNESNSKFDYVAVEVRKEAIDYLVGFALND